MQWRRNEPREPDPRSASQLVDLHCHSIFSDGEDTPEVLAEAAQAAGLSALALTDHDSMAGLPAFLEAAVGFEPVPGVEISARRSRSEVHILGLFVSPEDPQLLARLGGLEQARVSRLEQMIERLHEAGVAIEAADIEKFSPVGTVGRPHVAMALVARGEASSVDDAFQRFLRRGRPGYVTRPGPEPEEAIRWIHEAGGCAVLAHPGSLRHDSWIPAMKEAGLDGVEAWHPRHAPAQTLKYARLCRNLGLVPSGGSDYHGPSVGAARIGEQPVPRDSLERLWQRAKERRL